MKKDITVIIPVYNGEKYIARCIDSVIKQKGIDLSRIELLLLNDGSKDGSLAILKEYEKKYAEVVKVFDKKNTGVAKTRNMGIELATGKYTVFIDQDDYLDRDNLVTFFNKAEEGEYDIVVGGYKRPDTDGKILRVVSQPNTEYSVRYKISAAWAKIHRTDLLIKNNIRFYDNNYGEDIIFTMQENNATQKIEGIGYIGNNWFWNTKSVSNTSQRGLQGHIKIKELLTDMLPYIKTEMDAYYLIQTGVHYLLFSGRTAKARDFINLYKIIFQLYDSNGVKVTKNRFVAFGPKGALLSVRIAISGFVLLHRFKLVPLFAAIYCRGK